MNTPFSDIPERDRITSMVLIHGITSQEIESTTDVDQFDTWSVIDYSGTDGRLTITIEEPTGRRWYYRAYMSPTS